MSQNNKIWIDESLGIFINYNKSEVISSIMSSMFGANVPISMTDTETPGLASLLNMFIDTLIKSIGQFTKQFFLFKNTIDLLAGLELGELLGNAIPGLAKVIEDLKLFLNNPEKWMMKNLLGPLFDLNIPIPEFSFDLGAIIPILPFKINIPKIDPYGLLESNTPFNLNTSPDDIPVNWLGILKDEITKRKQEDVELAEKEITKRDFKKRSIIIASEQNINQDGLNIKLSKLNDIGIDVFDNTILELLQKIGHNYSNEKYLEKLIELKKYISINDKKMLKMLYDIGFNLNDPKHKEKLNNLSKYINLKSSNILILIEMGLNINNNNIINILKEIKIITDITKYNILLRLKTIGFNFNNENSVPRLKILSKYIDLSTEIGYNNAIKRNINLNNPYIGNILRKTFKIGLQWNTNNYLKTEKEIFTDTNIPDNIDYIKSLLKIFNFKGEYLYQIYFKNLIEKSNFIIKFKENNNYSYIEQTTNNWYDSEGNLHSNGKIFNIENHEFESVTLSHFYKTINQYKKYNITLDIPTLKSIQPYEKNYTYDNTLKRRIILNINEYLEKLELLKDFHIHKGWVINGVKVNENIGILDYTTITNLQDTGLIAVPSLNPKNNEISYDVLRGVYGNFDELGLNIKDPLFKNKASLLLNDLKIKIDESVILNTKRDVFLTYTDYQDNDKKITINLSNKKIDPKIYEDEKYNASISVINKIDETIEIQPTTTLIKFELLNKLGFNFQDNDYNKFIQKSKELFLDLSNFETIYIVDSLISIGWHWRDDKDFKNLNYFVKKMGFNFKISTNKNVKSMNNKLNQLNNIGFNFQKHDNQQIYKMNSIGINLRNDDTENVLENLIGFGINLNDLDWSSKLDKLFNLNINFSNKNWKIKLDNLQMLGIDFNGNNWLSEYNRTLELKQLGIDYESMKMKKKLSLLTGIGIDFSKPKREWMSKINGLSELNIISFPSEIVDKKKKYKIELLEKNKKINRDIDRFKKLNENPVFEIDKKINDKEIKIKQLKSRESSFEIDILIRENEIILDSLQLTRISVLKINPKYDLEISILENEKNKIIDKSYLLNDKIIFGELDKFEAIFKSGLNFYDKNWADNIKKLKDVNVDFSNKNWKEKFDSEKKLIKVNPILEWNKTIIETIKTLITTPLNILVKIIEKLVELIKQIMGIPTNVTKIVDWSKEIIVKFKNLIELLSKLPTLDGMMDFLFMSDDGLKIVDIFVPGFSIFMKKLLEKISISDIFKKSTEDLVKFLKDFIKNETNEPNKYKIKLNNISEELSKMKSALTKAILKKDSLDDTNSNDNIILNELNIIILGIKNKINDLSKKQKNNKKLSNDFDNEQQDKIKKLEDIVNWLPTIFNILKTTPKMMVNIFVGLFNAIGEMKNLPDLWKFNYIEI